jgi:hypothetical protein
MVREICLQTSLSQKRWAVEAKEEENLSKREVKAIVDCNLVNCK